MTVYVVKKIVVFGAAARIRAFHFDLFHGVAKRTKPDGGYLGYALGDRLEHPQRIVRTGTRVPDIFSPGLEWIVSERVRERLLGVGNIDFFQVVFDKIFAMDFREGDFSWYDDMRKQPPELFDDLREAPSLRRKLGPFYELIVPRNKVVGLEVGAEMVPVV